MTHISADPPLSVLRVWYEQNRLSLYGHELTIAVSKYNEIALPTRTEGDAEASAAAALTKDYTTSKIHRFTRSGRNARNINPPSRVLHVSNLPEGANEAQLKKLFGADLKNPEPVVQFFQNNRKQSFVRMESVHDAVIALISRHNVKFGDRYLRVSFSSKESTQVADSDPTNATAGAAAAAPAAASASSSASAAAVAPVAAAAPAEELAAASSTSGTSAPPLQLQTDAKIGHTGPDSAPVSAVNTPLHSAAKTDV